MPEVKFYVLKQKIQLVNYVQLLCKGSRQKENSTRFLAVPLFELKVFCLTVYPDNEYLDLQCFKGIVDKQVQTSF